MRNQVWLPILLVVLVAAFLPLPTLAADAGDELESHRIVTDPVMNARLEKVGAQVALGVKKRHPKFNKRLRFKIVEYVQEPGDINAVVFSDGRGYITRGAMEALYEPPVLSETRAHTEILGDRGLAAILAHETAHVALGHHRRIRKKANVALGALLLARALGANDSIMAGVNLGGGAYLGSYSRDNEYQADAEAVGILGAIGHPKRSQADVLKLLQTRYGNGPAKVFLIGWSASHPDTGKRIENATRWAGQPGNIGGYTSAAVPAHPSRVANGTTVVVVVDPEASDSYGYGFGRGYYYHEDLSRVTKQEAEIALGKKGYQVLVSTGDVSPLQDEIGLSNSEWGEKGENRVPKGYFAGAQEVFYASAYIQREQGFDLGDWRRQARAEGLKIGVLLRRIDPRTRKQLETFRGSGSVRAISRVRFDVGGGWNPVDVEIENIENLTRKAVGQAVNGALTTVGNPVSTSTRALPPTPALPPAPSIAAPAIRPVDVERKHQFTLYIRPRDRQPQDQRVVKAYFTTTLSEVMNAGSAGFIRGGEVVAVVDLDFQKSAPERFVLEGTLYTPSWEKLKLDGANEIKLFSR